MPAKSILLGLDGSAQSRYAAELSWELAKAGKLHVDAQHVVDSLAAWEFLGFDLAGFIGSTPYFSAHENMRASLLAIGQTLAEAYAGQAEFNGIQGKVFIDEGTTIKEICARAQEHDLMIIGHRPSGMESPKEDRRIMPRRSVAEMLTHYCPCPLLVVQDRCKMWKDLSLLLPAKENAPDFMKSFDVLAKDLSVKPQIKYIDKDKDVNDFLLADAEKNSETLIVVPVSINAAGVRKTIFGIEPDILVRYLNHSAILFWLDKSAVKTAHKAAASEKA